MRIVVLCFFMIAWVSGVGAQTKTSATDWASKPVVDWDYKDVNYLLNESPWSRTVEGPVNSGPLVLSGSIRFRLHSALNIRLALIRKRQLSEKYDSMDTKQKEVFDRKHKAALECLKCDEFYIVEIKQDNTSLLSNVGRVKARAKSIYLSNEKGEKRTLANFIPGNEALFYFPRNNDKGEPLLTPDNKTLTFHFKNDFDDDAIVQLFERVYINVRDIVVDGKVVF